MKVTWFSVLILFICACSSKHTNEWSDNGSSSGIPEVSSSQLVINEYSPKSEFENEFGEKADWVELYNNSADTLVIRKGEWSLSDEANYDSGFMLCDTVLAPAAHLLIWCDKKEESNHYWHAPFKLSGEQETIYLYYKNSLVDQISYAESFKKGQSYGRVRDGESTWEKFKYPTPGTSNTLLNHYAEALK